MVTHNSKDLLKSVPKFWCWYGVRVVIMMWISEYLFCSLRNIVSDINIHPTIPVRPSPCASDHCSEYREMERERDWDRVERERDRERDWESPCASDHRLEYREMERDWEKLRLCRERDHWWKFREKERDWERLGLCASDHCLEGKWEAETRDHCFK